MQLRTSGFQKERGQSRVFALCALRLHATIEELNASLRRRDLPDLVGRCLIITISDGKTAKYGTSLSFLLVPPGAESPLLNALLSDNAAHVLNRAGMVTWYPNKARFWRSLRGKAQQDQDSPQEWASAWCRWRCRWDTGIGKIMDSWLRGCLRYWRPSMIPFIIVSLSTPFRQHCQGSPLCSLVFGLELGLGLWRRRWGGGLGGRGGGVGPQESTCVHGVGADGVEGPRERTCIHAVRVEGAERPNERTWAHRVKAGRAQGSRAIWVVGKSSLIWG